MEFSDSPSPTPVTRAAEDEADEKTFSEQQLEELFESDLEEEDEQAKSSVGSVKSVESGDLQEKAILPNQLQPPNPTYAENGSSLPAEFELGDPIDLQFPIARVHHTSSDVTLLAPGEWIAIEPGLFDEHKSNGYVEGTPYYKRVVRWKKDPSGEVQCNSRLIEWDDGSFSLFVEGKCFDLGKESFTKGTELLCLDQPECLQALHAVETGFYTVALPSDESDEEAVLQSPVQTIRKPKTKRVTVLTNPVKDREEKIKKIEEERRDREMIERKQRALSEKYTLPSFDQFDEDEEESYGLKEQPRLQQPRSRPSRRQPARSKKRRPDDFDDSFIADDEEGSEGLELGEDFEEEIKEVEGDEQEEDNEEEEEEVDEEEEEDNEQEAEEEEAGEESEDAAQSQSQEDVKNEISKEDTPIVSPPKKKHRRNEEVDTGTKTLKRSVFLSQDNDSEDSED